MTMTQTTTDKFGPYLGMTHKIERPTANDPRISAIRDAARRTETLETAQRQWDEADKWRQENERIRADRLKREEDERTRLRTERETAEKAKRDAAYAALEETCKREFMASPAATEAAWERVKEQYVADRLMEDGRRRDAEARRAAAESYRRAF